MRESHGRLFSNFVGSPFVTNFSKLRQHTKIQIQTQTQADNYLYTAWHKKRELLKNPTKIEEIQEKKFIDRNWTITTCLLRDSHPNYQCLKITSCRWRRRPHTHSFTATTHFKSSHSFMSPVCAVCSAECDSVAFFRAYNTQASCNGSISVNNFFFLDFFNFCWVFQKFPFFCVTLYTAILTYNTHSTILCQA